MRSVDVGTGVGSAVSDAGGAGTWGRSGEEPLDCEHPASIAAHTTATSATAALAARVRLRIL